MKITQIHTRSVPIQSDIRNAYISFAEMTASIVMLKTDLVRNGHPVVGLGFGSNGRYSQAGILKERMIPRLKSAPANQLVNDSGTNFDPFKIWEVMMSNEKPGGHGERSVAVGVIDMAIWDLVAKLEERPLYRVLSDRFNGGDFDEKVFTYAAGGYYYPGKGISQLEGEIREYLEKGYDTVKIKVGGAPLSEDLDRIETVINIAGAGNKVAVDANGRFNLDEAIEFGKAIDRLDLKWYEEAGDPLDFALQSQLSERCNIPMATGENLFSHQDVRNLLRYAGLDRRKDYLQMDPALSYGLVEYLRMVEIAEKAGWSRRRFIPHGGHQFALHIAAGLQLGGNESYPGVFKPFGGFADNLSPTDGFFDLPDKPGIGIESKSDLMKLYEPWLS